MLEEKQQLMPFHRRVSGELVIPNEADCSRIVAN